MLESIFTSTGSLSMSDALFSVIAALMCGFVIGFGYMLACKKKGFGKDFIIGLVLIPSIVAVIIMLINTNVAAALSLGGAFALVRFRSAPGNAKDIATVFFAMTTGLACGLGYILFACVFTIVILAVLLALTMSGFAERDEELRMLKITIPENLNYTDVFKEVLENYTTVAQLRKVKTTNMGSMFELTYTVKLKEADEKEMIDDLRTRNGNLPIILSEIIERADALNSAY